jgi:hypothetical protein
VDASNIILADNANNSQIINANDGKTCNVTLSGRPLYKDGGWNTICLPFDLELSGSPLDGDGVEVRTLSNSSYWDDALLLRFINMGNNAVLKAGVPYLIKWDDVDQTLTEAQLVFKNVTIKSGADKSSTELVQFVGTFDAIDNQTASDLGAYVLSGNGEWYRIGCDSEEHRNAYIPACRGYLLLSDNSLAPSIKMAWGDNATGIVSMEDGRGQMEDVWYDLNGRKLDGKPTKRGIYIKNGKKSVFKDNEQYE